MVGRVIDGYKLVEFIGKGTFGSVYKCVKNDSTYAMKIFAADFVFKEFLNGEDNRITREIEALQLVDSEFVVKYIHDGHFVDNNVKYYYVLMDYVQGDNLETVLNSQVFPVDDAINIFISLLKGISAIHKANVIHRDLKPANIYLQEDKKVKILDFGLSKIIDFTSITSTGDVMGTPLYMSPEQIRDSKNIDYRSDYYALGVILFRLLSNQNPYGNVSSREELYYRITAEPPISIRTYVPKIDNAIDNLLNELLQKENYKRPNSIAKIEEYLSNAGEYHKSGLVPTARLFPPSFFLRLWNERTVLEEFYGDGYSIENAIFPINHQEQQRNLLRIIKEHDVHYLIDPATMRLAYDSYSDVKGLVVLPYAPKDLNRLELEDLISYDSKRAYVQAVIDEQLKHSPHCVVSPFHVSNNSNLVKIKMDANENWFSLDIKLLHETRDYLNTIGYDGDLIGGFCVKTDILTSKTEREYFLNMLSSLTCDGYWVYVDCIDNNANPSQLYNYALTLLELQKSTDKPVIAGRIGTFGLVLLAFGLYGFESGAARFESFYENLYKETRESYNMYTKYYMPELLSNVSIEKKNPIKIIQLLDTDIGHDIRCTCPYCSSQNPSAFVNDSVTKKHFLYRRNKEIETLRDFNSIAERVDYMESQITNAITYYKNLKPIFKDEDSRFLKTWLEVVQKLRQEWM